MSTATATLDAPDSEVGRDRAGTYYSIQAVAALLLLGVAHVPILLGYCDSLLALPQYEYILALPVFAGILIFSRARHLGTLAPGNGWIAAGLFLFAAMHVCLAAVFDSPWLGSISALWALPAVVYSLGGRRLLLACLPAWCMLWLVVRLPLNFDTTLIQNLQSIAARRGSVLLHLLGQPHILQGNVVETPEKVYAVEEACSGIQSLFAITACTLFFVLLSRMSWWRSLMLLLVGWWWVWAANVMRVVIVTYVNSNYDIPIDTGWMHDALGIGLFSLTLGLIYSSGRFLWFLFPFGMLGRRDGIDAQTLHPASVDMELTPTRLPSLSKTPVAAPWLSIFYLVVVCFLWLPQLRVPEAAASPTRLDELDQSFAVPSVGNWVLVPDSHIREERRRDSQWGAVSQAWRYRNGRREVVVSVDYPFMGWHDLNICYTGSGWQLNGLEHVTTMPGSGGAAQKSDGDTVVLRLQKPVEKEFGVVVFQLFNSRMAPLPLPQSNLFRVLSHRFSSYRDRLTTLGGTGADLNSQTQSFQLQVFLHDHLAPTPQDEADMRQLVAAFRDQLATKLTGNSQQASTSGDSR